MFRTQDPGSKETLTPVNGCAHAREEPSGTWGPADASLLRTRAPPDARPAAQVPALTPAATGPLPAGRGWRLARSAPLPPLPASSLLLAPPPGPPEAAAHSPVLTHSKGHITSRASAAAAADYFRGWPGPRLRRLSPARMCGRRPEPGRVLRLRGAGSQHPGPGRRLRGRGAGGQTETGETGPGHPSPALCGSLQPSSAFRTPGCVPVALGQGVVSGDLPGPSPAHT